MIYFSVKKTFVFPSFRYWVCLGISLLFTPVLYADFFLAPNGSDANPGTREKPFATLEAARDATRRLKAGAGLPAGGVTIWLAPGDYTRRQTLELGPGDSGAPDAPVVWRALPAAKSRPRLLGGRRLTGFRPVSDSRVRQRLPEAARAHVWECDLRALGITNYGVMKSRGFSRPTTPAHCELFFRHRPMTLARWPNAGEFVTIAGIPKDAATKDGHGRQLGKLDQGFFYAGDRPKRWRDPDTLWVHGYWAWDWANSYERVASLDPERRRIKTAPPYGLYGFRPGQRFYFLNLLEELDQPGEWFLDRRRGRLYFWPPDHADPNDPKNETLLSLLDRPLLRLQKASHVVFRGLVLEATRASAVEISGGAGNRIEQCLMRNLGDWAVRINGGRGHVVAGCDIFDTGDGGVSLSGGDRKTLEPSGHRVENCHFARQGRWSKCYVPAVQLSGVGQLAAHNLIHDHPHAAILFGGNEHRIEYNEIHHIALETGDVGAIYAGRDYTFRGNRIRYNYLHHIGGVGMGAMGVYMDDCMSGAEIYGNLLFKVHRAVFLGGGRDHRVVNNLFVDCDPAVDIDGRGVDPSPTWHRQSDQTLRQRLHAVPQALYRGRYPALKELDRYYGPPEGPAIVGDAFKGVPPEHNVVRHNVCVGKWLTVRWHAREEDQEIADNWTGEDPGFVHFPTDAAAPRDFALKPDAPAWAVGFKPLPLEQIGLRRP
jgi:hypothetical protein